jgi:hypothetical protein
MGWYSFCGIFKWERVSATGDVRQDASLVEERVVLLRAEDLDEAIRLGEAEAELYARDTWPNAKGDIVRKRYLSVCNVFDIKASPAEGVEVYSRLLLRSSAEDDDVMIERLLGSEDEQATDNECFEPDFEQIAKMNQNGDRLPE